MQINTERKRERPIHGLVQNFHNKKSFWLIGLIVFIGIVILFGFLMDSRSTSKSRTEVYKDVHGSAGLEATIAYSCVKQPCNNFDFNVYIFSSDGQQTSVIRPDKNGKVSAALPEGNYSLLVGKQFGKGGLFPQEPLVLKNGKLLELKLQYREG